MSMPVPIAAQVTEAVGRLAKTQEDLRKSLQDVGTEASLQDVLSTQTKILSMYKSGFKKDLAKLVS